VCSIDLADYHGTLFGFSQISSGFTTSTTRLLVEAVDYSQAQVADVVGDSRQTPSSEFTTLQALYCC